MAYNHLSLQEHHYIEVERKKGTLQKDIAVSLQRSSSTLPAHFWTDDFDFLFMFLERSCYLNSPQGLLALLL